VGDDCQSIYSFRRGLQPTSSTSQALPGAAPSRADAQLPARRPKSSSWQRQHRPEPAAVPQEATASRESGPVPVVVPTQEVGEQAAFVAPARVELREEGVPLEEMAVLYGAHAHSMELQLELTRRGFPSGALRVRFFEQAHVKDVLAHLRLVHNRGDELAFKRAGEAGGRHRPGQRRVPLDCAARARRELPLARPWRTRLQEPRPAQGGGRYQPLRRAARRAGGPTPGAPRADDEDVLAGGYADYLRTSSPPRCVGGGHPSARRVRRALGGPARFLSEIALVFRVFPPRTPWPGEAPDEFLTLSTVHQAKGLSGGPSSSSGCQRGAFPWWPPPAPARTRRRSGASSTSPSPGPRTSWPDVPLTSSPGRGSG